MHADKHESTEYDKCEMKQFKVYWHTTDTQ
jgi:hypothetical protein